MIDSMEDLKNEIETIQKELKEVKNLVRGMRGEIPERKISDAEAEKDSIRYIKQLGKTKVSAFEISVGLNLPVEQVERVFDKLEREGKVRDADE